MSLSVKKNTLIVKPRCTGKTSWIVDLFSKGYLHGANVLLVVPTSSMRKRICEELYGRSCVATPNVVTSDMISFEYLVDFKPHTIFIDEFDYIDFEATNEITSYCYNNDCSYIGIGTASKLYSKKAIQNVRRWMEVCNDEKYKDIIMSYNDLYHKYRDVAESFFADPHTEVIIDRRASYKPEGYKKYLSSETYKVEFLCDFLED